MAIPRSTPKKVEAVRPSRMPASKNGVVHGVVLPSKASVLRPPPQEDDDAMLHLAANQWGDHDAELSAQPRGVVLEGTMSQVAVLTRELKALETRYFRTREQLDKVTEKSDQLRAEMARLRSQTVKSERDNAKLRHLVDRIQGEKKQLEQQAISNRDYAKKIELKFFQGAPKSQTQTLVQCNLDLSARVKALEREATQREQAYQQSLSDVKAANDNVVILKRALETRFEELQLNGSLHNGVLFELAKLQDQNASMALQLGEERKTSKAVEVRLDHARARHVELEEHLVVRETWLASLEKDRADMGQQLAASESDRQTLAYEKATLLKFIQEQAEVKLKVESELKRVQEAKLADQEAFHGRLQASMDEKQKLQDSINELLVKLEKTQLEGQALDKSWRTEQQTTEELRRRQHEMFLELQRLQGDYNHKDDDFRAATDVCRQLQATVDSQSQETQTLRSKIDELEAIISALEQEIVQRKEEEAALRTAMETALRDLEILSKQRNDAARAMNEAVVISASSLDEQQALEAKLETQRKQLEQLKHAKSLLQSAMLEQLSALRRQLQTERLLRIEIEAKLKQCRGVESGRTWSEADETEQHKLPSPATPTPSYESEELQPLPPPEISMPSPLPPQLAMMQRQLPRRPSSPQSSSSSSSSDDDRDEFSANGSPPRRILTVSLNPNERTPERTTASSIPSPSENLSLLELAGEL